MTAKTKSLVFPWLQKIRNIPLIFAARKFFKYLVPRITLFHLVNRCYYRLLLLNTYFYQPLYNFSVIKKKSPERICVDRADAIYQVIQPWGTGARILDIGCNLGYFSFYFADRGFALTSIDMDPKHISICRLLQEVNEKNIDFSVNQFTKEFVDALPVGTQDISFVFSIMHHVIYAKGLAYAQSLIASLLEKVPVLFIELASRDERTSFPWRDTLPQDEKEIFALCKDVSIEKVGYFSIHRSRSTLLRPIYCVMKNTMHLCGKERRIHCRYLPPPLPLAGEGWGEGICYHQHYDCGDIYIKKYILPKSSNKTPMILNEIQCLQNLPQNNYFPKVLSYQCNEHDIQVSMSKLPGKNLHHMLTTQLTLPCSAYSVFCDVVEALKFLLDQGLYHNHVRVWNVLVENNRAALCDLKFASPSETESTQKALLWLIYQLHCFNDFTLAHPIETQPDFSKIELTPEFREIVNRLQNAGSFEAAFPPLEKGG